MTPEEFKEFRLENKYSQEKLAEIFNITTQTISRIEKGMSKIQPYMIRMIEGSYRDKKKVD